MNLGEITGKLDQLNGWSLEGKGISKVFDFDNFKESLDFVNKIGEVAERTRHHPDIVVSYNKVKLVIFTHSVDNLTDKDFELAKEIDSL